MALASCFTNARLDVKRDLGVRNLQSFVDLCKSMRLDISSGFSSLTSWITLFSILESSLLPCGRGTLKSFKTPSQLRMVVTLWVFFLPTLFVSWWHHSCSHQLRTETGRYEKIPSNERICSFCNSNKSEDENHFILDCKACSKIRDVFFSKIEFQISFLW